VTELGEEPERVLPADGVPGAPSGTRRYSISWRSMGQGAFRVEGETISAAHAIYQGMQRPVKVVTATSIRVGDWLEVGGQLRAVEGVEQRGFISPNGWVALVLMRLQGWAIVQVPADSPVAIRR
jgi:hypothetical protein